MPPLEVHGAYVSGLCRNTREAWRGHSGAAASSSMHPSPAYRYSRLLFAIPVLLQGWPLLTCLSADFLKISVGCRVKASVLRGDEHPNAHRSALDGLLRIARNEGPGVLWRGTDLSLLVAVPMVAMYFPLYDSLLQRCQNAGVPCCVASETWMHCCMSAWLHCTRRETY